MINHCILTGLPSLSSSSFDWYRATIKAPHRDVLEALTGHFDAIGEFFLCDIPPIRFYGPGKALVDADDVRVFAIYTSPNSEFPNVIASGHYCDAVVSIVRRFGHSPSRIDVCLDFASPTLWSHLLEWSHIFAKGQNITRSIISNDNLDLGSTVYLGNRQSQFFARIYQPGLLRCRNEGREGDDIHQLERQAVRIELEFKPSTPEAKQKAASLDPDDFWRAARWPSLLFQHITGLEADRIKLTKPRESDRDRALRHMAAQYHRHLLALLTEHHGDLASFGADIISRFPQISSRR